MFIPELYQIAPCGQVSHCKSCQFASRWSSSAKVAIGSIAATVY